MSQDMKNALPRALARLSASAIRLMRSSATASSIFRTEPPKVVPSPSLRTPRALSSGIRNCTVSRIADGLTDVEKTGVLPHVVVIRSEQEPITRRQSQVLDCLRTPFVEMFHVKRKE